LDQHALDFLADASLGTIEDETEDDSIDNAEQRIYLADEGQRQQPDLHAMGCKGRLLTHKFCG
jgi:hypothetical protein